MTCRMRRKRSTWRRAETSRPRSRDGGGSWEILHTDYTRSTIVPPARPDLVLAGPALEVGRNGRIEGAQCLVKEAQPMSV